MFVHLSPQSRTERIRRNGLGRLRKAAGTRPTGVFAMPVTRNFYVSHQWLRELKRNGHAPIAGVYFRIGDNEPVWIGHYNHGRAKMTAAEAVMSADNREGFEVIIPRRVEAKEIHRVRSLPHIVGWRYYPESKGRQPCPCRFCTRGAYSAWRMRAKLGADE